MKRLNKIEARTANGGARYFCKVRGYENDSYTKIFAHCAKHVKSWVPRWLSWSMTVINTMKHFYF